MGNSPPTGLRLSNGDHSISYHVPLGESAAVHFRGREVQQRASGEVTESWKMSYKVDNSTCDFSLTTSNKVNSTKALFYDDDVWGLGIDIEDAVGVVPEEYSFYVTAYRNEAGDILPGFSFTTHCWDDPGARSCVVPDSKYSITPKYIKNSTKTTAHDGITETSIYTYWFKPRRSLIVTESKRKSRSQKPYMGMVAHYYANAENGKDVGLSVAVKNIRVLNDGRLDFVVDGPQRHPVRALFDMFDVVLRTGTWKPTYCPHCANNNNIVQRQRAGMLSRSDSEDSDTDNAHAALLRVRTQNARGFVNNNGVLKGSNNGNIIINYYKFRLFDRVRKLF